MAATVLPVGPASCQTAVRTMALPAGMPCGIEPRKRSATTGMPTCATVGSPIGTGLSRTLLGSTAMKAQP